MSTAAEIFSGFPRRISGKDFQTLLGCLAGRLRGCAAAGKRDHFNIFACCGRCCVLSAGDFEWFLAILMLLLLPQLHLGSTKAGGGSEEGVRSQCSAPIPYDEPVGGFLYRFSFDRLYLR